MGDMIPVSFPDALGAHIVEGMNEQLRSVAEPMIKAATAEMEAALRKRLGEMLVGLITKDFNCYMMRDELHIVLHQARQQREPGEARP